MPDLVPDTARTRGARYARDLEGHIDWLETFSGTALGVLAVASGIYTYLGVSSLLDDTGAMSTFAALAYSVAVSVGIFVFWSYLLASLSRRHDRARPASAFWVPWARLGRHRRDVELAQRRRARWLRGGGAAPCENRAGYQQSLERAHEIALTGTGARP